ncbi:ThiF family adenylyltransferase, partial [Candidatus Entotheonella palauensis]|uniref:ThiF family adenylyltransferase n=1 Tax=Candidatus Entotheonella palauensis TaxID=93172 RepID=UPI0015C45E73
MIAKKFETNMLEFEPHMFDLSIEDHYLELKNLVATNDHIVIHDDIHSQIQELVKLRNPSSRFTQEELSREIQAEIGTDPIDTYGVWVYYPWSHALVHVLKEEDFISVRTNRNRYKITDEEQVRLRTKKVGVIGLSVGQSVAVTIAQERSCGELRLCDFDVLELSNYNRIRTRLTHLGLRKTVSVAREIKELDPFFKVVCFHDGLTPDNMDEFFLGGGTLDVCIDECDDVAMKILSRIKAKKLRVPVVMEASDNCTVDVERFDLEPERPLLHGYIDHLDVEKAAQLKTNEEKVPYMLAMLAPELMTNKMLASIFEINETITTWPQLASSIVYGGGICANVCRRVLLNTFTESGRHQLNVDAYFGDKSSPQKEWTGFQTPKRISEHEMSQVTAKFAPQQGAPSLRSDLEILGLDHGIGHFMIFEVDS